RAQGGEVAMVEHPERLPRAAWIETVPAPRSGYLRQVHARTVGETAMMLGAGRAARGDAIDHAVGVEVFHSVGDRVEAGEPLFAVHANQPGRLAPACERLLAAHLWSDAPVEPLPLFYETLSSEE
ncbi:MAG: pyrimidine-nucleoside phosphorylase, partial [Chloroflexi bacterium]|nr:pyrimidine-nucleoside phosphorylase [Chloroflexota bacterium]